MEPIYEPKNHPILDASYYKTMRAKKGKLMENFDFPFCNLTDKYEQIAKIGHGTFGEVFKAKDRKCPTKLVAMKKVLIAAETDGFPITALREIKILQKLKHDNIVNFIEVCRTSANEGNRHQASFYLVFDFCDHDLAGLLSNRNVHFSRGDIKKVMQQMLEGLYYLHGNKILHRDLKAANVLLTKDGKLKLADFGLSRAYSSNEVRRRPLTNCVVTLWYRAPELLLGARNYGPSIDLWALGCIMAEFWTRSPILKGTSEQEQLKMICRLCGTITPNVWPGVEELPLFKKIELPRKQTKKIHECFGKVLKDNLALDLLHKLLELDPRKRIDADNALNHEYFWTDPMPSDLSKMMSKHSQSMFEFLALKRASEMKRQVKAKSNGQDDEYREMIF